MSGSLPQPGRRTHLASSTADDADMAPEVDDPQESSADHEHG